MIGGFADSNPSYPAGLDEELGEYTVEQANEDKNWLWEQIKLVG
jgi:hypothetical protein